MVPSKVVGLICALAFPTLASAQSAFPSKPVKIIVPYAAGGPNDIAFRALGGELQAMWGQPLIVETQPGAGGRLAYESVARAAPDGHTLGNIVTSLTTAPYLFKDLAFDAQRDIVGVATILRYDLNFAINADVPAGNLRDFIAHAKANPGKLNYGSQGQGNIVHLGTELITRELGIKLVGVFYKGTPQMVEAAVRGDVHLIFTSQNTVDQSKGRLRTIAVGTDRRSESLPEVPTLKESGVSMVPYSWIGVGAPGSTPRPIVAKIAADIATAFRKPELGQKIQKATGANVHVLGPDEFGKLLRDEFKSWGDLIGQLGIPRQ